MSLRPIGNFILVKAVSSQKSNSGIIVPDNVKNLNLEAQVISVGLEVKSDIKAGDRIIYAKLTGNEITIDGNNLIILQEKDILAVVGD